MQKEVLEHVSKAKKSVLRRKVFDASSAEPFKLSRTKLQLFLDCPRCFYLDRTVGVGRPSGPPFTLNIAVDSLMKKEFDLLRVRGEAHSAMVKQGITALPLRHPALNEWRDANRGIQFVHPETNFLVYGAIDDAWVNTAGQIHVVDYKATSSLAALEMTEVRNTGYQRQAEVYQWLLEKNGFDVSHVAYFVYVNAEKARESFDLRLDFSMRIIPYEGSTSWIDEALREARLCLSRTEPPEPALNCEWCTYRKEAGKVEWALPLESEKAVADAKN